MALMDDKIIEILSSIQKVVPDLPNDVGDQVLETNPQVAVPFAER